MLKVSKKEGKVLNTAITQWLNSDVISTEESQRLQNAYEVTPFDWQRVAKYAFWIAIICVITAVTSVLSDRWLMEQLEKLFTASDTVKTLFFALMSAGFYFLGMRRRSKKPASIYSNEAILFLGVATTAIAITLLGKVLDNGSGHFSLLLLLAAILYAALGLWFPSKLIWVFSLLSLGSWFGAETGYVSGWGAYYLGMNYPMRFVLFGGVLIACGSFVFTHWESKRDFLRPTRVMGLLYLFIALWILSIFGNYGDGGSWQKAKQIELFHWSILFALAALAAIYHGVKYDDGMTRGFGITFLFINLYTRFFEHFWDGTHKGIFFALLAISFWYLGSKAEKIWQLDFIKAK